MRRALAPLVPGEGTTPEGVIIEEVVLVGTLDGIMCWREKGLQTIIVQDHHARDTVACWLAHPGTRGESLAAVHGHGIWVDRKIVQELAFETIFLAKAAEVGSCERRGIEKGRTDEKRLKVLCHIYVTRGTT